MSDDSGTLILLPTYAQLTGTAPITINRSIPKQTLKLIGYKFLTNAAPTTYNYINVFISEISNPSHLIDTTATSAFLALPISQLAVETFHVGLNLNFNMNSELPKVFYMNCFGVLQETGAAVTLHADTRLVLMFNYDTL